MSESKALIKLTEFSHGSGCGCKLAPEKLEEILGTQKKKIIFENLLVGNETRDDAAVYDLQNGTSVISTTDFFTPVVNDAYDFGRIASANAISDVYAMGGTPILAIAILGWPEEKISLSLAAKVMEGAQSVCYLANIPLAGGHSISSKEPFFGLSVNGLVKNENLKRNSTAKEGDLVFLTKPIGAGIYSTAIKRNIIRDEDLEYAVKMMTTLNSAGSEFGKIKGVSAMTDVTGFGLLGHLLEMCEGAQLSVELNMSSVRVFPELEFYISQMCFPDNTYRNWSSLEKKVTKNFEKHFVKFCDPQTNGGLMVSVHPDSINEFTDTAERSGIAKEFLKPIGRFIAIQKETIIGID